MNDQIVTQIRPGIYTVVYPCGAHRTIRVKAWDKAIKPDSPSVPLIVGFLNSSDNEEGYRYVGFLNGANRINYWNSFKIESDQTRRDRLQKAIYTIAQDPAAAGLAFALASSKCYRCGRTLTVPASIHNGLGPDCATRE